MKTRIVKIGNSQGIRIPKILLEQSGLDVQVELEVMDNQIVIRPQRSRRQGWDQAFCRMAEKNDDHLLDRDSTQNQSAWDNEEWEW